jgi:hypothetical protein
MGGCVVALSHSLLESASGWGSGACGVCVGLPRNNTMFRNVQFIVNRQGGNIKPDKVEILNKFNPYKQGYSPWHLPSGA